MEKGKGEKVMSDAADNSSLFGSMKGGIKINGDIFSTGAWLSDDEFDAKFSEVAAGRKAEAEVLEWSQASVGDGGDEPCEE